MLLILGSSSYIGKRLFEALGNAEAIGTHNHNRIPGSIFFDATCMSLSDILPPDSRIDHAIIFYAITKIDACKADSKLSYEVNVSSAKLVIDELVQNNIKPIFMSSEYVFDGERGSYTEVDEPDPNTVYGSQKLKIEKYLAERCDDFAILRLAKVFGTDPGDGTILSSWFKQIRNGDEIHCAYDQIFSPICVDDVISAICLVVRLNLSGLFHLSNSESCSRLDMLKTLLDCLGADARVVECSIRDLDFIDFRPLDLSMNPKKIIEATGLTFKTVRSCCEAFSNRVDL